MAEDTFLYRAYDANGMLLYVGITTSWISRLQAHRRTAPWIEDVARLELDRHPTREQAKEAEQAAIRILQPKHNDIFLTVGKVRGPRLPGVDTNPAAIRAARINLGLSGQQVSKRASVEQSHYSKIERGRPPRPSMPLLTRIAQVLEVPPESLLATSVT